MTSKPRIPNVLAGRYASVELATLWSPEHKIVLERQLWLAVLRAQAELGIGVDSGVVPTTSEWSTRSISSRSPHASGSPATT